jgi:hypothetical protein
MKHGLSKDEEVKLDIEFAMFFSHFLLLDDRAQQLYKQGILPTYQFIAGTKEGPKNALS